MENLHTLPQIHMITSVSTVQENSTEKKKKNYRYMTIKFNCIFYSLLSCFIYFTVFCSSFGFLCVFFFFEFALSTTE